MLSNDLKKYIADAVARKGEGGAATGICGSINRLVRETFRSSPIPYNSPKDLREYIVNAVAAAKKVELQTTTRRTTSATGMAYVLSVEPPLVRLDSGRREPFVARLPVSPGKAYAYYVAGSTVILEGVFEGSITRPRDYPVDLEVLEGFLFHPRTGPLKSVAFMKTVAGELGPIQVLEYHNIVNSPGYDVKHEVLDNSASAFPMYDGDDGTKNLRQANETEWEIDEEIEADYGNLDWQNGHEDPDKVRILSFKGPPGRHMPLDPTMSIPGLTTYDETVGETSYYTPFTKKIYEGGEVLEEAPDKVLGCALTRDSDGKEWLVTVCGENRRPDGFWNVVYAKQGSADWIKLQEFPGSRPSLPWFFNRSGTQAVNRTQLIELNVNSVSASIKDLNTGSGQYEIAKDLWSVTASGQWDTLREFRGDELVTRYNSLTGYDKSVFPVDSDSSDADLRVYFEGKMAKTVTIIGSDAAAVGTQYTYQLSDGNVVCKAAKWSMTGGTINEDTGKVLTITSCGVGTISVNFQGQGPTGSKSVRLPTGTWIANNDRCCMKWDDLPAVAKPYVTCNEYNCGSYTMIIGTTKWVYNKWPGWICWDSPWYECWGGICNYCGMDSLGITVESWHWGCP